MPCSMRLVMRQKSAKTRKNKFSYIKADPVRFFYIFYQLLEPKRYIQRTGAGGIIA